MLKKAVQQGRTELSIIRVGWDDPNCARPTRAFSSRALREHGDRPSYPTSFFSILLGVGSGSCEPCLFRESQHEVHGLYRLACRTLHQIIQCGHRNDRSRTGIEVHSDVAIIGALDVARIRYDVFLDSDESLSFVIVSVQSAQVLQSHRTLQCAVGGAQNATVHRDKVWGECDDRLCDYWVRRLRDSLK